MKKILLVVLILFSAKLYAQSPKIADINLRDRKIVNMPPVSIATSDTGVVAISVIIDTAGIVTLADFSRIASTLLDIKVVNACVKAAWQVKYAPGKKQNGLLTFRFKEEQ